MTILTHTVYVGVGNVTEITSLDRVGRLAWPSDIATAESLVVISHGECVPLSAFERNELAYRYAEVRP